jgi:hypothetical protein
MTPAESSTEIAPNEGPDDTKNYRDDATRRVPPWHQELCESSRNQTQ